MKVGLNLTFLADDSGGSASYAKGLIQALPRVQPGLEITAWVGKDAPAPDWLDGVDVVRLPVRGVGGVAHYAWDLAAIVGQARRRRLDVVHGLAYVAPPVHPGMPVVVTILDTIWKRYPATLALPGRIVFTTMSAVLKHTASRVVAISEAAREDLVHDLGVRRDRIDVTPLGVDAAPVVQDDPTLRDRLGLGPEPVVLVVAQKRPHKNLEAVIEAFARLGDRAAQLVLPGSSNAYEEGLRELAVRHGVQDRVRFCGWVSDADLDRLYAEAAVFVTASLMEGFGLPVLEAMVRGVPVVCSNVSAMPEVAADAALLVDPHDHAQLGDAIARLLDDEALRARLVTAGYVRAAQFTWDRCARATLGSYKRAMR